ncbi:MAG: asparagine synthase-related protein [Pseudomonadota bacterium]|nr:asparagine synthase-related protein [Pseudomonadota bacterium]
MYHFVAMIWEHRDLVADMEALRLRQLLLGLPSRLALTLCMDGMAVFTAQPRERSLRHYRLAGGAGIVLGRLFSRTPATGCPIDRLLCDDDAADQLVKDGGRRLVNDYWGSYVAFLRSRERGTFQVLRDCSGWIPCFRTRHANVELFFSDLYHLVPLELPQHTLNFRYLAAYICDPSLQIRETGLNEVTELLAGDCVEISPVGTRQFCAWHPRQFALSNAFEDRHQAQGELKRITQDCVGAWAGTYDNILLSLSGGLDSAIVLGCLERAPVKPAVTCFNQCTENTADDERRFARLAAALARAPLIEEPWSAAILDERLFDLPKLPKPYPGDIYWWLERNTRNDLAIRTGAEAIWTGQGGDHLFWAFRPYPIAADYVARHGIDIGLCGVVASGARLSRKSYLSVLIAAIKLGKSSKRWRPEYLESQLGHFVTADALLNSRDGYIVNPWSSGVDDLPKTKQIQIDQLADVVNRHKHMPGAERAYQRHPLQSQPLMELCLAIPTYVLAHGGRRRGLARDAFSDRVPRAIIEREDKGETSARIRAMIRQNEFFLRGILLDGILVKENIVSRFALEAILVKGQSWRPDNYWALLGCITAEIWARSPSVAGPHAPRGTVRRQVGC